MTFADYTQRITPQSLANAGISGVCRYLSYLPNPKVIRSAEYHELTNAGYVVLLNWEFDSHDWNTAHGTDHAREAVNQAKALGYPAGSIIPGSADFDMTLSQWNTTGHRYALDFAAGIRLGGYRAGVYGPYDVLSWCRSTGVFDFYWQAGMSFKWSGGRNKDVWAGVNLRQARHATVDGQDVDINTVEREWRITDMAQTLTIARDSAGKYYLCDGITSNPIDPGHVADIKYLAGQGSYTLAHGTTGEWTDGGYVRGGWTPDVFGRVPAIPATIDVQALATALNALMPDFIMLKAEDVAAAIVPLLPHHISLTGDVA
jgi:hypothetical protein